MTSRKTTTISIASRPTCGYPGCDQPAAQPGGPGRPPEYCAGRGHTRASAWKERRRLNAEKNGTTISAADDASPVTMAKVGGAELLRSLRAEADRISALDVVAVDPRSRGLVFFREPCDLGRGGEPDGLPVACEVDERPEGMAAARRRQRGKSTALRRCRSELGVGGPGAADLDEHPLGTPARHQVDHRVVPADRAVDVHHAAASLAERGVGGTFCHVLGLLRVVHFSRSPSPSITCAGGSRPAGLAEEFSGPGDRDVPLVDAGMVQRRAGVVKQVFRFPIAGRGSSP
jgi:hypothetical protein